METGVRKPIEQIEVGEMVLARNEFEPNGPLELKRAEELFTRTSPIIELEIGGQKIGTTAEHPFYVSAREAFVPARELQVGDQLISHDGRLLRIDAIHSTLQIATVYNLRVADYHTYFVGCNEWGFSVWAHNATCVFMKGSRLVKQDSEVRQLANIITDATTNAEAIIAKMTHATALTGTSRRMDLYLNVLKARNGAKNAISSDFKAHFTNSKGVVNWDAMEALTKGHAIQSLVDRTLDANSFSKNLILNGRLLLNKGSDLGIVSGKGNLLRPDYQLKMRDGRLATIDITTEFMKGKMWKYNHRLSPFLIEIRY